MATYSGLGLAVGVFTFFGTFTIYMRCITASYTLFNDALRGVMRSKVAWFDTTPTGRIMSRMSKDITTLDSQLPMQINQLVIMSFSILGTVALVFYTYAILGSIFVPLGMIYYAYSAFYRASSREVKRLDSLLRSFVYTAYGETLGGLASIRGMCLPIDMPSWASH